MKTKLQFHAEVAPILNKPGKFIILRQYVNGGCITPDNNKNEGYTAEEAARIISEDNVKFKSCPNCR